MALYYYNPCGGSYGVMGLPGADVGRPASWCSCLHVNAGPGPRRGGKGDGRQHTLFLDYRDLSRITHIETLTEEYMSNMR